MRRFIGVHDDRRSGHAFPTEEPDLDLPALAAERDHRADSRNRKIDRLDGFVRRLEQLLLL
ncbi:hypothetical protein [uncultured Jannaschia sp.]|uniref:hypothetical protein n=1 Tax=uncultured Jannaschia sp. TaxID=293347 RepID=UPI00260861E5|nr:hypothetical protein [uncultured Jannaschia sp.]